RLTVGFVVQQLLQSVLLHQLDEYDGVKLTGIERPNLDLVRCCCGFLEDLRLSREVGDEEAAWHAWSRVGDESGHKRGPCRRAQRRNEEAIDDRTMHSHPSDLRTLLHIVDPLPDTGVGSQQLARFCRARRPLPLCIG